MTAPLYLHVCTGLRKIDRGVYICKELDWHIMFAQKPLFKLDVKADCVNAGALWSETVVKAHADVRG